MTPLFSSNEGQEEEKKQISTIRTSGTSVGSSHLSTINQVIVPSQEEIKKDRVKGIQSKYVDAISRVFYHLRGTLDEPNFLTERIKARNNFVQPLSDGSMPDSSEC